MSRARWLEFEQLGIMPDRSRDLFELVQQSG